MRFGGSLDKNFREMTTSLVPYPRIHFITPAKAPHASADSQVQDATLDDIVQAVHLDENQLLSIDMENSRIYC